MIWPHASKLHLSEYFFLGDVIVALIRWSAHPVFSGGAWEAPGNQAVASLLVMKVCRCCQMFMGAGEQMQSWLRTTALDHTTKDAGLACNLALPGSGLSFTLKAPTIECLHDARTWEMLLLPSVILILYIHIFFFFFFFKVTSSLNYWLSHILFLSFQTDKVAIELTSSVREACSLLFISSPSDLQGYWHINFGVRSSLVAQCVKDLALSPLSLCHCCGEDSIPGPGTSLCCGCGH